MAKHERCRSRGDLGMQCADLDGHRKPGHTFLVTYTDGGPMIGGHPDRPLRITLQHMINMDMSEQARTRAAAAAEAQS